MLRRRIIFCQESCPQYLRGLPRTVQTAWCRCRVTGMDMHAGMHSIDGIVPLSEMFGYATDLRSRTQGRGNYTMLFSHYAQVNKGIADKILGNK